MSISPLPMIGARALYTIRVLTLVLVALPSCKKLCLFVSEDESDSTSTDSSSESAEPSEADVDGGDLDSDGGTETEVVPQVPTGCAGVLHFRDPVLEAEVRDELNLSFGDLYYDDVKDLTTLNAANDIFSKKRVLEFESTAGAASITTPVTGYIQDLHGIECLTGLIDLDLWANAVSDLSPLASLTSLTYLGLGANLLEDLTPLADLDELTSLDLSFNDLDDLSPLSGLTNLSELYLWFAGIGDIDVLSAIHGLSKLDLRSNRIENIAPLAELENLNRLYLEDNRIADIRPLVDLAGIARGMIDLRGNPIECDEPETNSTFYELATRHVDLRYDCKTDVIDIASVKRTPLSETVLNGTWECKGEADTTVELVLNADGTATVAGPDEMNWLPMFDQGTWFFYGDILVLAYDDTEEHVVEYATVALIGGALYLEVLVRTVPPPDSALWDGTFSGTFVTRRESLFSADYSIEQSEYALTTEKDRTEWTERVTRISFADGTTVTETGSDTYRGIGLVDWSGTDMEIFWNGMRRIENNQVAEQVGGSGIGDMGPRIAENVLRVDNRVCTKVDP